MFVDRTETPPSVGLCSCSPDEVANPVHGPEVTAITTHPCQARQTPERLPSAFWALLACLLPLAANPWTRFHLVLVAVYVSIGIVVFRFHSTWSPPLVAYIWACGGTWALTAAQVTALCTHLVHHRHTTLRVLGRRRCMIWTTEVGRALVLWET